MATTEQTTPGLFDLAVTVNGTRHEQRIETRTLLSDFLRHDLGLTATHVACEHRVCGACTVLLDGEPIRSCLVFAVQANGHSVTTVEGLGAIDHLHPVQEAFRQAHGVQCGFCTPGILTSVVAFLADNPDPSEEEIREALSGNLCRCTGYQHIVDAVRLAAQAMKTPNQQPAR
jgi:carbon-monoxide dehydrogenase small subunit